MRLPVTAAVLLGIATPPLTAQVAPDTSTGVRQPQLPDRMVIEAARFTGSVQMDGRLDEPAWELATPYTDFLQRDPIEGQPASERTEVRMLVGPDAIYIGARLFDSDPAGIRARLGRRDEPLQGADFFEAYFDTFADRLTGYVFRVTAAGAVRDAVVTSGGTQDASWDAVWESAVNVDAAGWTVEIRIPFSQLRYDARRAEQIWGVQFARTIARKGESSFLPFAPKRVAVTPATWADLSGLGRLPRARYVEFLPYVTGRAEYVTVADNDPFRSSGERKVKAGLDARFAITTGFTLSGAMNPDFGQVEVDPARVNLTANELFFPERRPLFVEEADIFRYGQNRAFNFAPFPIVFHSRRIGRTPQRSLAGYQFVNMPEDATIAGALKLVGKSAGGLSLGVVNAVTTRETARVQATSGTFGEEPVEPFTNYFAGRVRRTARGGNTFFGAMLTATNRDLEDSVLAQLLRRDAYFAGFDLNHAWRNREWVLDAALGASLVGGTPAAIALTQRSPVHYLQRPDREEDRFDATRRTLNGMLGQLAVAKRSGVHWIGSVSAQASSPQFEANDIGFHALSGYTLVSGAIAYKEDKPGRIIRNHITGIMTDHGWNADGDMTAELYAFLSQGQFVNFWPFRLRYRHLPGTFDDRLTRGGPVARKPWVRTVETEFSTDTRKVYVLTLRLWTQRDGGPGWEDIVTTGLSVRPNPAFRLTLGPEYAMSRNPVQYLSTAPDTAAHATYGQRYVFGAIRFNQVSLVTRMDWTFSPRLSLQIFAQPLAASGVFSDIRSLAGARTFSFDRYSEADGSLARDSGGNFTLRPPGGAVIQMRNPDFNTRSLVGNAVLRWEYRPGSTLYLVWQQRRSALERLRDFNFSRDVGAIFGQRPENILAIKATYWLAR
ncbi:MAG: DUF5916 domain-containing protein [Gemmatimonadaceae bacterium]